MWLLEQDARSRLRPTEAPRDPRARLQAQPPAAPSVAPSVSGAGVRQARQAQQAQVQEVAPQLAGASAWDSRERPLKSVVVRPCLASLMMCMSA